MKKPRVRPSKPMRRAVEGAADQKCSMPGCDYDATDIDHIDEDRSNTTYENLIALCPNHHRAKKRIGVARLREIKRIQTAKDELWRVAFVAPIADVADEPLSTLKGRALAQAGSVLRDELEPKLEQARELVKASKFSEAEVALRKIERAVRRVPTLWKPLGPTLLNNLGICAYRLGRVELARRAYLRGLSIKRTWKLLANLARLENHAGRNDLALDYAMEASRRAPRVQDPLIVAASSAWSRASKDSQKPRALLARAKRLGPLDFSALELLSQIALHDGDADDASVALEAAFNLPRKGPHPSAALGVAYVRLAYLRLAKDPSYSVDGTVLSHVGFNKDPIPRHDIIELRRAGDLLDEALRSAPSDETFRGLYLALTRLNRAIVYSLVGLFGKAMRHAGALIDAKATRKQGLRLVGQWMMMRRHPRFFLRFIDGPGKSIRDELHMRRWRAAAYMAIGDGSAALEAQRAVMRHPRREAGDRYNLGVAMAMADSMDDEFRRIEHHVNGTADAPRFWRTVAYALLTRGECAAAKPYLERERAACPEALWPVEQLARLALLYEGVGAAERILGDTEPRFLSEGGSVAWAALHLRRGSRNGVERQLKAIQSRPQDRRDRPIVLELIGAASRGMTTFTPSMGCKVLPLSAQLVL